MKDKIPCKKTSFYRAEAINNRLHHHYGTVMINTPVPYQILTLVFSIISIFIILFLCFAQFSEKFIVSGYINSTKGVVRVFPGKNGVIVHSNVIQGMHVKKGDELFLIDTSYDGLYKDNHNDLLEQIQTRKASVEKQISDKKQQLNLLKKLLIKQYITQTEFNNKKEEIIALENSKSLLEIELIKYNQDKSYRVRAPVSGTVSAVIYKLGQSANMSKPLVKILPDNANLIAELFVPVNKSGFIDKNNKVLIRYDAYPYQNFGTYEAKIHEISQSILTDVEEEKPLVIGVPYYKITAILDSQFVTLYGQNKRIQDGMTFSAVIMGKKRKVWQWILDPLYSYRGELFS